MSFTSTRRLNWHQIDMPCLTFAPTRHLGQRQPPRQCRPRCVREARSVQTQRAIQPPHCAPGDVDKRLLAMTLLRTLRACSQCEASAQRIRNTRMQCRRMQRAHPATSTALDAVTLLW